jgi:hypothetical protein
MLRVSALKTPSIELRVCCPPVKLELVCRLSGKHGILLFIRPFLSFHVMFGEEKSTKKVNGERSEPRNFLRYQNKAKKLLILGTARGAPSLPPNSREATALDRKSYRCPALGINFYKRQEWEIELTPG